MADREATTIQGADEPIVLVSADTHAGPLLADHLRAYCPKKYLDEYDRFVRSWEEEVAADDNVPPYITDVFLSGAGVANLDSPGHYDMDVRLKEMDADGVAAEVIFHASENGQPIPFQAGSGHFRHAAAGDPELAAAGLHMYNQWLADACSIQPERHAGLVHLPMWDVDAAVKELEWAREVGLRGVNFPAMRAYHAPYNDPSWEPLWSAAEDSQMALTTHIGGGSPATFTGPEAVPLKMFEDAHIFGYRAIHWMIFGGVFERHPGLKLVITEIAGDWWPHYVKLLDDNWYGGKRYPGFREKVPRKASEYAMKHVYLGESFMARFEAEAAIRDGYADRIMWGSDYPHIEGTWQKDFDFEGEGATHLALRSTFAGTPERELRMMAGETAIDVYNLDAAALIEVARRIEAPTPAALTEAPAEVPKGVSSLAFRKHGTWT